MPPIKRDRYVFFQGYAGTLTPLGVLAIICYDPGGGLKGCNVTKDGLVNSYGGPLNDVGYIMSVKSAGTYCGIEIEEVVEGLHVAVNETVPDWNKYENLNP